MLARFVLVHRDGTQTPLTPLYDGPYRVLERSNHIFRLQIGDRTDNVSTAANTPADTVPATPPRRGRPPTLPPPDPPQPSLRPAQSSRPTRPRSERHVQFRLPPCTSRTSRTDASRPSRAVRPPVRLNL